MPHILAPAVQRVRPKLAFIEASTRKSIAAPALLLTFKVLALIARAVGPLLPSLALLPVVDKVALVGAPLLIGIAALAAGLALLPVAAVDVAVGEAVLAEAVGLAVEEPALVAGPVGPLLPALEQSQLPVHESTEADAVGFVKALPAELGPCEEAPDERLDLYDLGGVEPGDEF